MADEDEILEALEAEFSHIRGGEVDPDYSPFVTAVTFSVGTVYHQEHWCDKHNEVHEEMEEEVLTLGVFFNGSEEEQDHPDKELMFTVEGAIGQLILSGKMGKIFKQRLKKMND
jgi:hypothetical protein